MASIQQMEIDHRRERMRLEIMENKICAMVGKQLEKHYPGWAWLVNCRLETGLVAVFNTQLSGRYGFYLPIAAIINETDPKLVMRAGGEILERYHQTTGAAPERAEIQRKFTGEAIGDTADAE